MRFMEGGNRPGLFNVFAKLVFFLGFAKIYVTALKMPPGENHKNQTKSPG